MKKANVIFLILGILGTIMATFPYLYRVFNINIDTLMSILIVIYFVYIIIYPFGISLIVIIYNLISKEDKNNKLIKAVVQIISIIIFVIICLFSSQLFKIEGHEFDAMYPYDYIIMIGGMLTILNCYIMAINFKESSEKK